jgi:outer membrane protein OmpA-like peptidoglycan-associated protein
MKTIPHTSKLIALAGVSLLLAACSAAPVKPDGAELVHNKLLQLQANPQLATRAPVAIKEAQAAVLAAQELRTEDNMPQGNHLVYMADRKVEIANARAQTRFLVDQRKQLSAQREGARLDSRTLEADQLKRQIAELNAKETERGLVVTLGDVLFEFDKSQLKGGAANNLNTLVAFLNSYPDRSVLIEGHTDSAGSNAYNFSLSQRRAESVRRYLINRGIAASRLDASGKGETSPVASNADATGRQMNRRVEVVIANPVVTAK